MAVVLCAAALWLRQTTGRAATIITVCAANCTYNNAQLQNGINALTYGDTLLVQQNFQYVGAYKLKDKGVCAANNFTCYITIRTGVSSTGAVLSTSLFPAANVRITPAYASVLASLKVLNNNEGSLETEYPPSIPQWWKIQWLEFESNTYGGDTIIRVGSDSNSTVTQIADQPNHIYFDQIYVHGDPTIGQLRGISIHGKDVTLVNSYFEDIKSTSEGQVVWVNSSDGPIDIENNYLSGGSETFFMGGSSGSARNTTTIASGASTTGATLTSVRDLRVGQEVLITVGGTEFSRQIVTIVSNAVTWTPALAGSPDVPGTVRWGTVNRNLTFKHNYVTKPLTYRNTIVATPAGVSATAIETGGTLAAGNYCYKVTARHPIAVGTTATSTASSEVCATIAGATGSVVIAWNTVSDATAYDVYGRSSGGENIKFSVSAPTITYTDTGSAGTTAAVPTGTGTRWQEKNTWETKNLKTGTVEYNVIENAWSDAQTGYCVLFTGSEQRSGTPATGGNPSAVVQDVEFRYNVIRSCTGVFQVTGTDALANGESGRSGNINIHDNLAYDIGTQYGASTRALLISLGGQSTQNPNRGPYNLTFNHNTIDQDSGNAGIYGDLNRQSLFNTIPNFIVTNNLFKKNTTYGIVGTSSPEGNIANFQGTGSSYNQNVFAGATCSAYPTGTLCPSIAALDAAFTNVAARDYTIKSSSAYYHAGTDSMDLGANIAAFMPEIDIAISGNNTGSGTGSGVGNAADPLVITTATVPNGLVGSPFTTTTFAATGGTLPYVWTVYLGNLPSGLSLSSGGVLSGLPDAAGTYSFTLLVTDSTGAITHSPTYSSTISEVVLPAPRPDRMGLAERALFARTLCTDVADTVREGDFCYDLTEKLWKYASSTSPANVWTNFHSPQNFAFVAGAAVTYTDTPAGGGEFPGAVRNRVKANLVGYTQCALTAYAASAGIATTDLDIEYFDGSQWQKSGITISIGASSGFKEGAYQTLAVGARTDMATLRPFLDDGNSTLDPSFTSIHMTCK